MYLRIKMKKLLFISLLFIVSFVTNAQESDFIQIPNSDFEQWDNLGSKNEEPYRNYMILLLLENLHEIPVIQSQINNGHVRRKVHPVYYSLDTNLLTHPLFDCIYQCEEIDGKPHIDRIRFRFTRTDS